MKTNDVVINIVDQLGAILAEKDDLKKREKKLKKQIMKMFGKSQVVEGDLFNANLVIAFRDTLDADKVREFLHPNQVRATTKTIEVKSIKLTSKPQG